ncbi:DUF3757 domain-containing protein [Pseudomonas sp. MWU15-20650]|uniref:DUF3757 domain-containing protein n=1 Tax=Pseudomonas sp. MWU15-20650 TaxID=2933107 RepID=UPI00200FED84
MRFFSMAGGVLLLQLVTLVSAAASSRYFDIPEWPGDEESCPSPGDIKNNLGIFSSPAKSSGVVWTGVLLDGGKDDVVAFKKGIFLLGEEGSKTQGFLSSCVYLTAEGRYLNMRLDLGKKYAEMMWITHSSRWKKSPSVREARVLECTETGKYACGFFLN